MALDTKNIEQYLPQYLSVADKALLIENLEAISQGGSARYVMSENEDFFQSDMLQGDGWKGFTVYDTASSKVRTAGGLVLSNSCDVDPNNRRDLPARIIFAPLMKFANFTRVLENNGVTGDRLHQKLNTIISQQATSVFHLPAGGALGEDYIVRLDDAHSVRADTFLSSGQAIKLFTLSNTGFYMLLFKLSVHFCRLKENLNRRSAGSTR